VDTLAKSAPERAPTAHSTETQAIDQAPLALTDAQLTQVMRHAAVLHPHLRRVFVEHVAYELRGQPIGDGAVYRACAKVLRESGMFDPPDLDSGRMPRISKWER
jgi:hypothetical protein